MNSRERVKAALNHKSPDRTPIDFGSTPVTGIAASAVHKLRVGLGLYEPGQRIKVIEPFQMLGEVDGELRQALGVDTIPLSSPMTMFGFRNENWKPWTLFDGTPVWVPKGFNTEPSPNGDILLYPQGDKSAPPSGRMPKDGFYFDAIIRQDPIDEAQLDPADNLEEFGPISDDDLSAYEAQADKLYRETELAIIGNPGGLGFGDIALVPATQLKHPRGIRDVAEWYISTVSRRDYILEVFDRQSEIALDNLESFRQAVGKRIEVIFTTGTDFGTQRAPFISRDAYRELYKPFHKRINDWVHTHTGWKTFMHTCGAIEPLVPDFIEAGFDILNPLQFSAAGMDPQAMKAAYGDQVVFWGGGIDTQRTLPFGAPDEVRDEIQRRVEILSPGGGFVFNTIHNVQATTPTENLVAMAKALQETTETHP